jgi:hypothetical protein
MNEPGRIKVPTNSWGPIAVAFHGRNRCSDLAKATASCSTELGHNRPPDEPSMMHARRCPGDGVRVWSASVSPAVYYDSLSRGDLSGLGSYDFNPVLVVDLQMAGNQIPCYSTLGEHYLL